MKISLKILFLLFLLIQSSCEDTIIYDCEDCLASEPYECDLEIRVFSQYNDSKTFYVTVYKGKVEDDIVIYERVVGESLTLSVPLNAEYSVKAVYTTDVREYISINSTFPRVEYMEDYCEIPCYFIKGNKIDVRIKYY